MNQGSYSRSTEFQDYLSSWQVNPIHAPMYLQNSNEMIERMIQSLINRVRRLQVHKAIEQLAMRLPPRCGNNEEL